MPYFNCYALYYLGTVSSAKAEMPRLGLIITKLYSQLSADAVATRSKMWKAQPKMHMFQNLTDFVAQLKKNPSEFWNYLDEDYVAWVAQLAHVRGGFVPPATLAKDVLSRVRALMDG